MRCFLNFCFVRVQSHVSAELCCLKARSNAWGELGTQRVAGCSSGQFSFLSLPESCLFLPETVIVWCIIHCCFPCIFQRNAAEPMAPCPADYSHVYVELGIFYILFFFFLYISAVCQGHSENITGLISFWNNSFLHPNHWRKYWIVLALRQQAA